ncbi:Uncharacterised protein [Vibrio cholerae]|nr:Uncharacterised protein [Vibrio cholerae]
MRAPETIRYPESDEKVTVQGQSAINTYAY